MGICYKSFFGHIISQQSSIMHLLTWTYSCQERNYRGVRGGVHTPNNSRVVGKNARSVGKITNQLVKCRSVKLPDQLVKFHSSQLLPSRHGFHFMPRHFLNKFVFLN